MESDLAILKALADPNRYRIIRLLQRNDFCVGALAKRLQLSEAAVSQHLRVLRKAGIVTGEKRGYYTHYDINRQPIARAAEVLDRIAKDICVRQGCKLQLTGDHQSCEKYLDKLAATKERTE